MILVVEPEHLIIQILSGLGYSVLRLRYHECIKAPGRDVPRKIRNGELIGICITYHEWRKRIPKEVISKFNKEMNVWLRHSCNIGIKFMVIGLTGTHWDQPIWVEAETNKTLHVSKHRFCGLDLKLRTVDAPSNLCVKVLSTDEHESTPCPCGMPFKDHVNDWHPYGEDDDRITHREATTTVYKLMCERGILEFKHVTLNDAEPMFPTDERVEWKRKRKENKEKGIEVKKRTKVVEEHFDDCGDNLAGLNLSKHELVMYYCLEPDYEPLVEGLCTHWLKGSEWSGVPQ